MKQLHQHLLNILIHNFYHKPFQMNEDIESIENSLISNDLDSTIHIVSSYSYHLLFSAESQGMCLHTNIIPHLHT